MKNPWDSEVKRLVEHASKDETRYHLTGIYADISGHYVATDGHRLYATKLIPTQNEKKGEIYNAEAFKHDTFKILMEGAKYPNWQKLLPDSRPSFVLTLEVPKFLAQIKRFKEGEPPLSFSPSGFITLGKANDARAIHLNPRYLAAYATGELVSLRFTDRRSPVIVTDYKDKDKELMMCDWFGVIMPINYENNSYVKVESQEEKETPKQGEKQDEHARV
jgi:hypothetical protein